MDDEIYVQEWDIEGKVISVLEERSQEPTCSFTLHVASPNTFYAKSTITSSTLPSGCATISDTVALLKSASGDGSSGQQGVWVDLDKNDGVFLVRERSAQGLVRVRWKLKLSTSPACSMFSFLQLLAKNTLRLQKLAVSQQRATNDQATIAQNWKHTAQQLEGQWSKEKAVLLQNVQILLSEKHKYYTEKIGKLQTQLDEAEEIVAAATKQPMQKAPPTPDAPDDLDQLEYDDETVRRLAAGERLVTARKTAASKSKKAPTAKSKGKAKKGPSLLPSKKAPPSSKPAPKKLVEKSAASDMPPGQDMELSDDIPKVTVNNVIRTSTPTAKLSATQPMEEESQNVKPKRQRPAWMDDSDDDSETDDDVPVTRSTRPTTNLPQTPVQQALSTRRKMFDDSSDEELEALLLKRRQAKKAESSIGNQDKPGSEPVSKGGDDNDDNGVRKLVQNRENSDDISTSSTEADIMKQLESLRH